MADVCLRALHASEAVNKTFEVCYENIADASLPNTHATKVSRTDWGWFDWLLEIISVRSARVKGTWGYNGESLGLDPSLSDDPQ